MKRILVFCFAFIGFTSLYSQKKEFSIPEVDAKFLEGNIEKYISDHIIYPTDAKKNNIQGTVFVSFEVESDGSVSKIKIIRGVNPSLDKEAIRVISQMPKWSPAMDKGHALPQKFSTPVKFVLQGKSVSR